MSAPQRLYVAAFDRIGREHDVPPLSVEGDADSIAEQIYRYARPMLGSRDVKVMVDLENFTGIICCGQQTGGHVIFSEAVSPPPASEWAGVCPKCGGLGDAHKLTCATLQLPHDVPLYDQAGA